MTESSRIAVLGGTGPLGRGLAQRWLRAGHDVVIGSRSAERAAEAARELESDDGGAVSGAEHAAATAGADVVVVAVPAAALDATLGPLADVVTDVVTISAVNGLSFDAAGPVPQRWEAGSAAQRVAQLLPAARVVCGLNTVSAVTLRDPDASIDADVLLAGDDDAAVETVAGLVDDLGGARPLAVGPLRLASVLEDLSALIISANKRYGAHAGVRLTDI